MEPVRSRVKAMFDKPSDADRGSENVGGWEVRPGGMLVQKRNQEPEHDSLPIPTIRIEVRHGSSRHEIRINPQASFGELKKMLAEKTRVHPDDQKILYKKRERNSKSFLDVERVKDGSKLVLVEDSASRERRCLEMVKIANLERAKISLAQISSQVDKFAQRVTEMEGIVSGKGRVVETEMESLTGNLMSELVRLDELVVEGHLKLQKRMQEKRVQKFIEALDKLKLHNSEPTSKFPLKQKGHYGAQKPILTKKKLQETAQKKENALSQSQSFLVLTKWETFD